MALWQAGELDQPALALLWAGLDRASRAAAPAHAQELVRSVTTTLTRLGGWLRSLPGGAAGYDPLPAAASWHLISWLLAGWAAWAVRRHHRPLWAIAPAGALLAAALSYSRDEPGSLLGLLAAVIPLIGLVHYQGKQRRWQRERVDYSEDIIPDLGLTIVGLTLLLTAAALLMPIVSIRPAGRLAWQLLGDTIKPSHQVAESLGLSQQHGRPEALEPLRVPGLPRQHLLGAGPELAQQVVLVIQTESAPERTMPVLRWRSHSYDRYTGRGWLTSMPTTLAYHASQAADGPNDAPHLLLHQEVSAVPAIGGLLYTAGHLITASRDYQVAWRSEPEQDQPGDIFGAVIESNRYVVDSWLPTASVTELREAPAEYPAWLSLAYWQLPDDVPPRVRELAQELTANAPTAYDKASALENYLRAIPYTLELPAPPAGREISDYFLFDLRRGYCDYYATAMVVMARAAGLPTRLVVGYAGGVPDPESGQMLVSAADAHSWVEIYFSDYGWIEFEPTASRPVMERPTPQAPGEIPEVTIELEPRGALARWWPVLLLLPLALTAYGLAESWRLRRLGGRELSAVLYRRLERHGDRLLHRPAAGTTPYELAERLAEHLAGRAAGQFWQAALGPAGDEIRQLTERYVLASYCSHRPLPEGRQAALRTWRRLRRRLWLARLRRGSG